MRIGMSPTRTLALGTVALAALLSLAGIPVTSAQGQTLFPGRVDGPLPVDAPFDPAWDSVTALDVALSGQQVALPRRIAPAFPSVRVRTLMDSERIAFLVEWDDPTLDDDALGVDRFADSAAIQFAMGSGTSVCMGQQGGALNMWHWKADWAAGLTERQDLEDIHPGMPTDVNFPSDRGIEGLGPEGFLTGRMVGNPLSSATLVSSVEDLNAAGFGTLTSQPPEAQNVHGASEHREGIWRVVMSRALDDGDPNDLALRTGDAAAVVAFAVWDGSSGDRNGQKSVSTWLALSIPEEPIGLLAAWPYFLMMILALGMAGAVLWLGARQPAVGLGWPRGWLERRGGSGGSQA